MKELKKIKLLLNGSDQHQEANGNLEWSINGMDRAIKEINTVKFTSV